jgi:WD40 repeat protein
MQPEREAAAAATPPGDGARSAGVQQAVEQFIELHATGQAPDPATFARRFPEDMRSAVLAQCREFLAFDGLLGRQEWTPVQPKEAQGRPFGDFVIQEELGRGGMGVVYLAHQKSLNRRVALKVMASGLTLSKRHVERFRREAAAAAQLRHPAIVSVHSLTEIDGTFALAMDYIAGRNLADILDDLRLANGDSTAIDGTLGLAPGKGYVAECALFVAQLAQALAVAHQANVVHRDLKPRNLMIDDRRQVRLLDFGLAKSLGDGSISMSGEITGTAHYMSPEQTLAKRVEVDHRADIWALGVILYELLTLRRPFDGKNLQQVVYAICFQEPVPPNRLNHKVPRDLVTICHKLLEKDPKNRYQSAADVEADLLRFLRWEPIQARPAGAWTRATKWLRRHRTESALAGALLLAGLGALCMQWYHGRQADALLAAAAAAEEGGRFADAYQLANQALALRNDETTRSRLKLYAEADRRIEAEAALLALRSKELLERDRERSLQLALDAERLHGSADTRSAVLDALGRGSVTRTLRPASGEAPRLVAVRWSPDGAHVLTLGYGGHAQLWDAARGTVFASLHGHAPDGPLVGGLFAGDDRVLTVGTDRTLRCWSRADGALLHTEPLAGIAAHVSSDRDGRHALVLTYGSSTGPFEAQVFDARTGRPRAAPLAHPWLFVAGALSADGAIAATCSGTALRLWRVDEDPPQVHELPSAHGRVRALQFSPDGALLAIATGPVVQLVRTSDGRPIGEGRHSLEVTSLAFDGNGSRLLSGSRDWTARLWEVRRTAGAEQADLIEVATLVGHQGPVDHVAFDRSSQLALTATGGQAGELCLFDVGEGRAASCEPLQRYPTGPSIEHAEFAPGGNAVLALAGRTRAFLWDLGSACGVVTMRQAAGAGAVAFDATGLRAVTASSDERLRLWSTTDGNLLWASPSLGKPQTTVDVDEQGHRIASGGRQDPRVHIRRLTDGEPLYQLRAVGEGVAAVRFHGGGALLLTAGKGAAERAGGLLQVWHTSDWSRRLEVVRPRPIVAADAAADGSVYATIEEGEATIRLWNPDGSAAGELAHPGRRPQALRFSPDGAWLLVPDRDGTVRALDRTGAVRQSFACGQPIRFAAWSRDGRWVVACGEGREPAARVFEVASGAERLRFTGHRGAVDWGAFSHDGASVATTARDGTVCVWPTDPVAVARRLVTTTSPPADAK